MRVRILLNLRLYESHGMFDRQKRLEQPLNVATKHRCHAFFIQAVQAFHIKRLRAHWLGNRFAKPCPWGFESALSLPFKQTNLLGLKTDKIGSNAFVT